MKKFFSLALTALILAGTILNTACGSDKDESDETKSTLDLSKYITVPEKGTITLKKSDIDKAYMNEINDILNEDYRDTVYTELTDGNETVRDGDRVSIRYYGRPADDSLEISEETIANMSNVDAENDTELVIGSGAFIGAYESEEEGKSTEGFEDQLIGWKNGQTGDITVTFPDDYENSDELQGLQFIFRVTINKIERAYVTESSAIEVSYEFEEDYEDEDEYALSAASDSDEDWDDPPRLSDMFKQSTFTIDYAEGVGDSDTFNDLFHIKDYADLFKGQSTNFEYRFIYTVTEEATRIDEDYMDYIGRTFAVKLTVTEITDLPEWTDELVADYTGGTYTTVAEFETELRKDILANQALEAIMNGTVVISYPESEYEKLYNQYVDTLVFQKLMGDPSTFTQEELDAILTDEVYTKIYAEATESAQTELRQRLIYEYLFNYYGIEISNSEYKELRSEEFNTNLMYYYYYSGYTVYDEASMEAYVGKDNLMFQFKYNKLYDVIADYVVIDEAG